MTTELDFVKRCRTEQTDASDRKIWRSKCGHYRVVRSRCRYGPRRGKGAMPIVWYAEVRDALGWCIISRHRKREQAFAACNKHFKKEKPGD